MKKIIAALAAAALMVCAGCSGAAASSAVSPAASSQAESSAQEVLCRAMAARLAGDGETYLGIIDLNYMPVVMSAVMTGLVPNSHISGVQSRAASFEITDTLTDPEEIKAAYSGYADSLSVVPDELIYADAQIVSDFTYDGQSRTVEESMTAVMTHFSGGWYLLDLYYPEDSEG